MTRRASAALALALLVVVGASGAVVALIDDHASTPVHRSAGWLDEPFDHLDDLDDLDDLPIVAVLAGTVTAIVAAIATVVRSDRLRAPATVPVRHRSARGPPPR